MTAWAKLLTRMYCECAVLWWSEGHSAFIVSLALQGGQRGTSESEREGETHDMRKMSIKRSFHVLFSTSRLRSAVAVRYAARCANASTKICGSDRSPAYLNGAVAVGLST